MNYFLQKHKAFFRFSIICLLYFTFGALSLVLSEPLDYAIFIWFPAGIAYASLILWGRRYWKAVWLGAFLTGMYYEFTASGFIFSIVMATGVAVQTYISAHITKPIIKRNFSTGRDKDLLVVLILAGPVFSLIGSTVSITTRFIQGKVLLGDFFGEWLLWWAADTLGIIIGAPLFLLAIPSTLGFIILRPGAYRVALPVAVIASLLLAGNIGYANLEKERDTLVNSKYLTDASNYDFDKANEIVTSIQGIASFFSASEYVTQDEFDTYTNFLITNPAIIAIDWIVQDKKKSFSLKYTNSKEIINKSYGFNHESFPARLDAINKALASKTISATPVEKLKRIDRNAVLIFCPIYNKATPGKSGELLGIVVGIVDIEKLFLTIKRKSTDGNFNFRISDITLDKNLEVINNIPDHVPSKVINKINFADRTWQVEVANVVNPWRAGASPESKLYIIFSVLATLIAIFAVLGSAGRNANSMREIAKKALEIENELKARVEAEKKLSDSKQDLFITLNSIGDAVLTTDSVGIIKNINPKAEKITGWNYKDAIGKSIHDVYVAYKNENKNSIVNSVGEILNSKSSRAVRNNVHLVSLNGQERSVAQTASPIIDESGEIRGVVLVFRDISKEVAAQKQLKDREDRYRSLINLSPFAILVHCSGKIVFANPMAVNLLSANSVDDLLDKDILNFVHTDYHPLISKRIQLRKDGDSNIAQLECDGVRLDGKVIPISFTSTPYEFDGQKGSLLIVQDLSKQKENKDLIDRFFSLSQDLLCIVNSDGIFKRVNSAFNNVLGWSEIELNDAYLINYVHPDDVEKTIQAIQDINNGVSIEGFENRYACKDGSWRRLEWKALPQPDGLFFASARDCTERYENAERMLNLNDQLAQRIEESNSALMALHAKEQEVRAILDNLLECVIKIDSQGIIQTANPSLEKILGYKTEEVIGENISILMDSPHRESHDSYLQKYLKYRNPSVIGSNREVVGKHKNGNLIPLDLSVAQYDVHGEIFFVGTLHDISSRKKLIYELTRAREAAEEANKAKSSFLASMSHEIRTPMNGVIGLIDVLDRTQLSNKQQDLVNTIKESSSTLLGIIDDILDFSKIESGNMQLDSDLVSISDVIENLCNTLLPSAVSKNVDLYCYISPKVPSKILSDEIRLHQILFNLIGNAIKFTSNNKGPGEVYVRAFINENDPLNLCITIKDNGIGIPQDKLEDIFNPFIQAEASTTRRFGGTGLGLAITQRLVHLMRGNISVDSQVGIGSIFTINIPINKKNNSNKDVLNALDGKICALEKKYDNLLQDIKDYLESEGAVILSYQNKNDLMRIIDRHESLIIFSMPEAILPIDEFDEIIKQKVKIINLSKGRRRKPRVKNLSNLSISLDVNALRKKTLIDAVLYAEKDQNNHQDIIDDKSDHISLINKNNNSILIVEDDVINQKVVVQQLSLLGLYPDIAENGLQALEMIDKKIYKLIISDLHMPIMDGYTLLHELASRKIKTPVIALTANAIKGEEQKALDAGFDSFLTKPIRLNSLKNCILKYISKDNDFKYINLEEIKKVIGDSNDDIFDILMEYKDISNKYISDMDEAFSSCNNSEMGRIAHKLKSSARFIGALKLGELAEKIEKNAITGITDEFKELYGEFKDEFNSVDIELAEIKKENKI